MKFIKNKLALFMSILLCLLLFLNINIFGYTTLVTDNTNSLSTFQTDSLNEGGNQLCTKNIYVYFKIFQRNTSTAIYDAIRSDYFEQYNTHESTDKIAVVYYFIEDPNYDNGCMYYYDDNTQLMSYEKVEEINEIMTKYNKKKDVSSGIIYLYNNIVNNIAKTQNIKLNDFSIVEPKYGGLNFVVIPTLLALLIVITLIFAFRKRK